MGNDFGIIPLALIVVNHNSVNFLSHQNDARFLAGINLSHHLNLCFSEEVAERVSKKGRFANNKHTPVFHEKLLKM
jgi:hypothetical protein